MTNNLNQSKVQKEFNKIFDDLGLAGGDYDLSADDFETMTERILKVLK